MDISSEFSMNSAYYGNVRVFNADSQSLTNPRLAPESPERFLFNKELNFLSWRIRLRGCCPTCVHAQDAVRMHPQRTTTFNTDCVNNLCWMFLFASCFIPYFIFSSVSPPNLLLLHFVFHSRTTSLFFILGFLPDFCPFVCWNPSPFVYDLLILWPALLLLGPPSVYKALHQNTVNTWTTTDWCCMDCWNQ